MTQDELELKIADRLDINGPLVRWIDREREIYRRHCGRNATRQGEIEHIAKMLETNPAMTELLDTVRED